MVSPNMTYPKVVKAAQRKVIDLNTPTLAKLNTDLAAAADPAAQGKIKKDIAAAEKAKKAAEDTIKGPRNRSCEMSGRAKSHIWRSFPANDDNCGVVLFG